MKDQSISQEQEQTILKAYVQDKRGLLYTSKQAHCSIKQVKQILKKNKIHIRNFSEAATESNQNRSLYKREEYFDKQTPNMAWILGFLAADGCVSAKNNTIKIGLAATDKEILERIRAEIQIENPIHDFVTSRGFSCVELKWTCKRHKDQLAQYGIIPQKTFKLRPPYRLDDKFAVDYIRGYFDGDGSVNFIQSNGVKPYTALRWQVCSATPEILEYVLDKFEDYGIKKVAIQIQRKNRDNPLYCIQYSTNATKQIYKILYGTKSDLFLRRKKDHYEEIIQRIEK